MNLDDLQHQWRQLEQKLDRSLQLETELARRVVLQPARRRVSWLAFWPALDVVLCVGGLLLGGSLIGDHWSNWRLTIPAGAIAGCIVALLINSIWQLNLVAALDWSGPVATIQRSLGLLRLAKVRQFKWIILLSPLLWICGLMVAVQWLDAFAGGQAGIFDKIAPSWIVANVAFGILFIPAGYFVARLLAARCGNSPWWQSVLDGISGTSLKLAAADVAHWADLQRGL